MLLGEDPIYAALYTKVTEKVEKARHAVDLVLIDINQRLEDSERNLQILRDQAAELQDGTKVFKSTTDGSIYTEHGKRLSGEKAKNIVFPDHAPKWETYRSEKAAHDTAARQKQEVEAYQSDVLDHATKRMNDEDNPPSMDELKKLNEAIEAKKPEIVKSKLLNKELSTNTVKQSSISNAHEQVEKTNLNVPDMGQSFDLARVDIPDLDIKPETEPMPAETLS